MRDPFGAKPSRHQSHRQRPRIASSIPRRRRGRSRRARRRRRRDAGRGPRPLREDARGDEATARRAGKPTRLPAARRRGRRARLEGGEGGLRVRRDGESVAVEDEREGGSGNGPREPDARGAARRRIGGRGGRDAPGGLLRGRRDGGSALAAVRVRGLRGGLHGLQSAHGLGTAHVSRRRRRRGRLPRIRRPWRMEESVSAKECADRKRGRLHGARRGHGIAVPPSRPRAGEAPVAGFFLLSGL